MLFHSEGLLIFPEPLRRKQISIPLVSAMKRSGTKIQESWFNYFAFMILSRFTDLELVFLIIHHIASDVYYQIAQ